MYVKLSVRDDAPFSDETLRWLPQTDSVLKVICESPLDGLQLTLWGLYYPLTTSPFADCEGGVSEWLRTPVQQKAKLLRGCREQCRDIIERRC